MQDASQLSPGFMILHGNRLESLRQLLVDWMREHPLAPLENELVLVQSNGIAQWLEMALAADREQGGCGIAAAIDVQLPAQFLWDMYRAVLGRDSVPKTSPLDKQPLTWRLLRLLPGLLGEPAFAPLQRFLADDDDCRKRYQLAERLADLFDQYQVYRADWLNAWAAGDDSIALARKGSRPLDTHEHWQPALWRAVLADVGSEQLSNSRAGVHPRALQALLNANERPAGLPRRVIVFGISSLPAQTLEALAALGRFSQVLLAVLNPCQFYWGDIVADRELLSHQYRRQQARPGSPPQLDDSTLHQHAHPLLAAWGKQGRDYINLLDVHDERSSYEARFAAINGGRVDLFEAPEGNSLLQQLQQDILELRPLAETRERWPALACESPQAGAPAQLLDSSIRLHIAHSAQREVEILHDQLLDAFARDPNLRPRDVIVMLPEVDTYAPHIQAVFGQYAADDPRYIPYTLADQNQRGREPLLIALEHLLQLPHSRLPVSEVLDLLDVPALRNRFGLEESDLPTLQRWIEGAGIRWGLDQQRRSARGLPAGLEHNSWRFGWRRMLLGYASGQQAAWGAIEPYDEVGGLDAALIGPLDQLLQALDRHEQALASPASPVAWSKRLSQLLADFLTPASETDQLLIGQLQQSLDQWLELCAEVGLEEALPLNVVAEAWLQGVGQQQLSQRFLAGAVNVCTLMPMRAIPFRMVCLLGMNDGDYPRAQPPLDFDLMASDYRPGDRSRREDDRYLLLEALLSARDSLYISWVGRSIRDNGERPPSVLIGQLRDHLAAGWRCADPQQDLLAALTTEHPLQPFSRQYFDGSQPRLFSYARDWRVLHEAPLTQVADSPLAPASLDEPIDASALQGFLRRPAEHFFTRRLKVWFAEEQLQAEDDEPFALDGLQRHNLSQWLLQRTLASGMDADWAQVLEQQSVRLTERGSLPLAGFGERERQSLIEPLRDQLVRYRQLLELWDTPLAQPLAVTAAAPGIRLQDWLGGWRSASAVDGQMLLQLETGRLLDGKGKQKTLRWHRVLGALCRHLLACAGGVPAQGCLIAGDASLALYAVEPQSAQAILQRWLQGFQQGLCQPLPLALESAMLWLRDADPGKAAKYYEGRERQTGEVGRSVVLQRSFPDFASLQAAGFNDWAEQLYRPLLDLQDQQLLVISAQEDEA
ncbi:exodeoxyribonuclease V subunit gamma [Halopseudomonas yangmingensis]|uniref:RecBCD enzyme subunit RecC n=1 Tax=Halopseudomonas yangmingensis TaxID=1720063 RepID=A0A1I4PA91_9GAMM|nr:exodeoxyribonuclease V subunit gamma [Halopseudomonas yangmingensis]SFM24283.1 DNA helicase/exodeoxyribonuclease V, gamma subunit [Halopseudomonas yangmingensis]